MGSLKSFKSLSNITKMGKKLNGTYYKDIYPDAKEILRNKHKGVYKNFIDICKMSQEKLEDYLVDKLKEYKYDPLVDDGFIYARGTCNILLTAHMDTVHEEMVRKYYLITKADGNHIITSPQGIGGDDRCGIYMILKIIEDGYRPFILFCEDEEIGRVGAKKFVKTNFISELEAMKYMIELDRANENDAVFYDCDNEDFTKYILEQTGYTEAYGSFSDISTLAPEAGVAAVNLSCGYYNAHTEKEEVVYEEMISTTKMVEKLLTIEKDCNQFEYIESPYSYSSYGYYGYYGNSYKPYREKDIKKIEKKSSYVVWSNDGRKGYESDDDKEYSTVQLRVEYIDKKYGNKSYTSYEYGSNQGDAWKNFFMGHPDVCWKDVLDYDYDYKMY